MKLTFEQTVDDLMDLSKNSVKNNRLLKIVGPIFIVLMVLNLASEFYQEGFNVESILSWGIPILLLLGLWFFLIRFFLKKRLQNPGNKQMMTGEREIELSEEEIRIWTPVAESVYQWMAVTHVSESKTNYFLYLGKAQAIVVPKRAFSSAIEKAEFESLVASKTGASMS